MALSLEARQALLDALRRYTKAGISPDEALEAIAEDSGALRKPARRTAKALASGATLTDALQDSGAGLTEMECALLDAGESGGRLEEACGYISGWLMARIVTRRQIIRRSLYPVFLLHFAAFVGPLPALVLEGGSAAQYFTAVGLLLLTIYAVALILAIAFQTLWQLGHHLTVVDRIWRMIPILNKIWRDGALGRFCGAMNAQISAGISPMEALPRASAASRIALVQRGALYAMKSIQEGSSMTEGLRKGRGAFPKPLLRALQTGETTGQLDEELARWAQLYQENEAAAWESIGDWTPKLIYLAIAIIVGIQIIKAAQGIVGQYERMLEGI